MRGSKFRHKLLIVSKTYWPKDQPPIGHILIPHPFLLKTTSQNTSITPILISFFWARGKAAGLSRGIFPGAGKRTVPIASATRAQKGYPAHIPRAAHRHLQLSLVLPKHAHRERRQVRRSQQHCPDPLPARRKFGAPQTCNPITSVQKLKIVFLELRQADYFNTVARLRGRCISTGSAQITS